LSFQQKKKKIRKEESAEVEVGKGGQKKKADRGGHQRQRRVEKKGVKKRTKGKKRVR